MVFGHTRNGQTDGLEYKKEKRRKARSDVVQIPFLANPPLCQRVAFRSGRISGAADVKRDGHLHSLTNRDLFDTVISLGKIVPFNTERACLNEAQQCVEM